MSDRQRRWRLRRLLTQAVRPWVAFILVLVFPLASAAKPRWYRDKWFWLGEAVIAGSVFVDYHSTAGYLARCRTCADDSPLLGRRPSRGRIAGVGVVAFASYSVLHWGSWVVSHDDNRFWRNLGRWGVPAIAASVHVPAAVSNYRLEKPKCPSGSFCNF